MADIIELWTTKRDTLKDRWTVLHVYGQTGGVEVARCAKEGRPGWLYVLGMCSAASDTVSGRFLPETVLPARAAPERSRFPHCEAISRKSYDTDVLAAVPDTPEGVAILDFVAPATLRAIDLAAMDAATTAGDAA